MNATSLYVSTCRLVLQADLGDQSSWTELYRLVPYLRQSLSCTVCNNLLIEPQTPSETYCYHHVCNTCRGGRKKLKPSCSLCKNYDKYVENVQLRILLQCYKKLCEYITTTQIYKKILDQANAATILNGIKTATTSLVDLIHEGAGFKDDYKSAGVSKSAYSILPCVYTNSSTQTNNQTNVTRDESPRLLETSTKSVTNGNLVYSVLYTGTGNKITIKRKAAEDVETQISQELSARDDPAHHQHNPISFKKPSSRSRSVLRKGCRCGNATATPGKLTCCGQRCPCYVESKSCIECKCRGCRNPHRPDGFKVRPQLPVTHQNLKRLQHISVRPELHQESSLSCLEIPADYIDSTNFKSEAQEYIEQSLSPGLTMHSEDSLALDGSLMFSNSELATSNIQVVGVYASHYQDMSGSLSAELLLNPDTGTELYEDDITSHTESSPDASDVEVEV